MNSGLLKIHLLRLIGRARVGHAWAIVIGGICVQAGFGQPSPALTLDPSLRITQYVHESWDVKDGLPQNSVYATLQTRDGYLWLGTQEGLVRFDGVRFTVYDKSERDGLQSNEVRALVEDGKGALWIGTNGGGVSRLYDGRMTTYTAQNGLSSDLVRSLYEDRQGNIWIGTIDGGLNRWDGSTFTTYTTDQGLCGNVVLSITEDAEGTLWAGTEAGLSRIEAGDASCYSPRDGLPAELVWAVRPGEDGGLWVGTAGGLAYLFDSTFTSFASQSEHCGVEVSALYEDAAGSLWMGTLDGGLCRFRDGTFERFSTGEGLTHDRIRSIYQDREASLWIGTEGGGVNRLREGKFTPVTAQEGLSSNETFTVLEDRTGAMWVGTHGSGVNRLEDGRVTRYHTGNGLPSNDIYALAESRSGALWVGMLNGGVCQFSAGQWRCYTEGLASTNVYALHEDGRGTLWIGTDYGLHQLRDGTIAPFDDGPLSQSSITAIHQDRAGFLWVGTYGEGLSRLLGNDVDRFTSDQGLSSDIILTLHEDADGTLWVGTQGGGICRLLNDRVSCVTARAGLQTDNILQIEEDDSGYLWLGSNKGILRISKQELHAAVDGEVQEVHSVRYGLADGLESSEANGGTQPASWRSHDGRLWFSTLGGLAVIDPANISLNSVPPPVVLETAVADGISVILEDDIVLGPGLKQLSFQYTGLSLAAPDQVRFSYKLEGFDEDWVDAGTRREAYYTNLPPGRYRFIVKASNNDGVWSPEHSLASLELRPHFYETVWFALATALAVILAIVGMYRIRINQLRARGRELERIVDERTRDLREEKEKTEEAKAVIEAQAVKLAELDRFKTRFYANISHEFRTPLTMIVGPLENALHGSYGQLPARLRQQTEIMLRNGLRLLRLINQLLDLSKLEAGKMALRAQPRDIVSFLEGIVLSCSTLAERKGIDLSFSSESEACEMYYEPDKLEKVFFNLLSNALKFTPADGRVTLSLAEHAPSQGKPDGAVEVRVVDTGKGIPQDQLATIFDRFHQVDGSNTREHEGTGIGLSLARELVQLHRGEINVESVSGAGATFIVTLPKGCSHLDPDEVVQDAESEDAHHGALAELASSAFDYMHADEDHQAASEERTVSDDAPLVLVADDNKDVREYVADLLSQSFRVVTAKNGEDALERAIECVPDIILSDVMMPRMDGNELCRRVKSSPLLSHVPVILLTAKATHQLKMEGLAVGADDYLAKPFNAQELLARIDNLLRLRRQEKELKELSMYLERRVQEQVDLLMRERAQYEAHLIVARDRAEASDRLKSAILNNMNHEFRTPLTAITGYAGILKELVPGEYSEFTDEIQANGDRLLQILSALLDLAQITGRTFENSPELVDVSLLAGDTLDYYRRQAEKKGLAFKVDLPAEPALATLNPGCLRRVLAYVVDNAVKFTESGHVRVHIDLQAEAVCLQVEDTGIGISESFIPHLFEEFTQESDGDMRLYEGAGLGLAITQGLVTMVGGSISVESEKGRGSSFTVTLPVYDSETDPELRTALASGDGAF